jgi:hypothetical protein
LPDNFLQHRVQILLEHDVGEVDKADVLAEPGFVEEGILLLIAQHLQCGFAQNGEIKRGFLRRGIGENELMRHGGFAATGHARDHVKGEFRDAAAHDLVQAADAGRQFADSGFTRLAQGCFWQFEPGSIIF